MPGVLILSAERGARADKVLTEWRLASANCRGHAQEGDVRTCRVRICCDR
jgi:hypothetical protein